MAPLQRLDLPAEGALPVIEGAAVARKKDRPACQVGLRLDEAANRF
jgi:hypothetical protein